MKIKNGVSIQDKITQIYHVKRGPVLLEYDVHAKTSYVMLTYPKHSS